MAGQDGGNVDRELPKPTHAIELPRYEVPLAFRGVSEAAEAVELKLEEPFRIVEGFAQPLKGLGSDIAREAARDHDARRGCRYENRSTRSRRIASSGLISGPA